MRADAKLFVLHRAIQGAMGWTDSHLHQFLHRDQYYGTPDPEFGADVVNERQIHVGALLQAPKDRLIYEYDFGDSWAHDVVVEAIADSQPRTRYPRVTGGKRACPPEDVGGVPGYANFLEAVADPRHSEHESWLEWVGAPFNPEDFDIVSANDRLP